MKFTAFVGTVSTAVATVSASPLESRMMGGVHICTGANATGLCTYQTYAFGKCNQLEEPYFENSQTFAPDGDRHACYPYSINCNETCNGPSGCGLGPVDFGYENKYDMSAVRWDKYIRSFHCYEKKMSEN